MAPDGADPVRRARVAELLAQVRDAHVERAVEPVVLALVELQVERFARLDLAGATREEEQQVELVARERDVVAADGDGARGGIDRQLAEAQDPRLDSARPRGLRRSSAWMRATSTRGSTGLTT